jgi:flagellar biogenesis protein FliO
MERSDATPWLSAMIAALAIFMFSLGMLKKMQDRNSQS